MSRTRPSFRFDNTAVARGETRDLTLKVSERYTGDPIRLPIRVIRAVRPGPSVFITAAVHGNELNGVGIIHDLMFGRPLELTRGTVILVPVVNIFGFETQDRYMPDRRDLNRFFPGSESGSLTSRVAHRVFRELVPRCDYGIDLHTAAAPRTNFPNVRGDLSVPEVRHVAHAFGCELIINGKGPEGSLRREATRAGCPTLLFEAGEPGKIEPGILDIGVRGIHNVLKSLSMMPGIPTRPAYQTRVEKATWVRAKVGGILRFHVAPGEPVDEGQPIATNASVFGLEQNVLRAPVTGVVLGLITLPTVKPGEPVCYIAIPRKSLRSVRRALSTAPDDSLHRRLRDDLATNISVSEREGDWTAETSRDDD